MLSDKEVSVGSRAVFRRGIPEFWDEAAKLQFILCRGLYYRWSASAVRFCADAIV